ncbi:ATP-binding protein [Thiobaca trueperi]|uniref:ATP-binding protein n=1 Tax=Thiobaca trueperi TaxID=127458 RepID=UPI001FB301F9|nr:ATP-binding protein [Thiobaca trueperi]
MEAFGRAEIEALARERQHISQRRLETAIGRAGIPPRFQTRTFDAFTARTPEQQSALAVARRYAANFQRVRQQGNCLLLVGGPGTGKTHLACAVLQDVIRQGHTGLFVGMSEALRTIRSTYAPGSQLTELDAFATFTRPDLLVLDEIGVAIGDDEKRRAMLFDLLNARYGAIKPVVLIGNLTEAELHAYLGERIMDRLLEGGVIVPFTWASHRRQRQPEEST